jgi:hypothetical protein
MGHVQVVLLLTEMAISINVNKSVSPSGNGGNNNFQIFYQKVCGSRTKSTEIYENMCCSDFEIILFHLETTLASPTVGITDNTTVLLQQ